MNYAQIERMARKGVSFFADKNRPMKLIKVSGPGYDSEGFEIDQTETSVDISGATRNPSAREVDGDTIRASDLIGIFNNDHAMEAGDFIEINGERYVITDPRPVQASLVPAAYRPILRRISVNG